MHTEPRTVPIDRIYLHMNEGPQAPFAAQNLEHYLRSIDAGYHVIVDADSTVVCAGDQTVVWGAGGDNSHSLHVCMIGYSGTNDWYTDYSKAMVERAAQQVAAWCRAHDVPVAHITGPPSGSPTERGVAKHADNHDPRSAGHTDPGANFPIDLFLIRVYTILHPAPEIDWHKISILAAWVERVAADPLYADTDPEHPARPLDTKILRDLLIKHGAELEPGTVYGPRTVRAVAGYKAKHGLRNRLGEEVHGPCARALLKA